MKNKTQTTWMVWVLAEQPARLRFATEAEAQAAATAIRQDGWREDDIRVTAETVVVPAARKTSTGWNSGRPDANSREWAGRGYGDGDL